MMGANELLSEALKLPLPERQAIAERLWQSLDVEEIDMSDTPAQFDLEELKRRVASVKSGKFESVSFEESIPLARQALAGK